MTRYFVTQTGEYIGGFDGTGPPPDAVEVLAPPAHAAQRWDGLAWSPPPPDPAAPRRARIAQLLAIPRADWTAAQYRELLELVAQELPTP